MGLCYDVVHPNKNVLADQKNLEVMGRQVNYPQLQPTDAIFALV